ncbi:MAG: hypothetical protein LBV60_12625 [Streptomyces sp.]|jgi:DNA-binding CsgD family transcriptional regulator|nr:hypothetical protein [Streptomyces sp.]
MTALAERRRQAERFLRAGFSNIETARRVGLNRKTVARLRQQLGLPGYLTTADSPTCRHGHPFPENRAYRPNGWLYCRACNYQAAEPDDIVIERAVAGDPPGPIIAKEIAAAIGLLDTGRLSAAAIARRIGCAQRTVVRHRALHRSRRVTAASRPRAGPH